VANAALHILHSSEHTGKKAIVMGGQQGRSTVDADGGAHREESLCTLLADWKVHRILLRLRSSAVDADGGTAGEEHHGRRWRSSMHSSSSSFKH
jgi:hypothetical protein